MWKNLSVLRISVALATEGHNLGKLSSKGSKLILEWEIFCKAFSLARVIFGGGSSCNKFGKKIDLLGGFSKKGRPSLKGRLEPDLLPQSIEHAPSSVATHPTSGKMLPHPLLGGWGSILLPGW